MELHWEPILHAFPLKTRRQFLLTSLGLKMKWFVVKGHSPLSEQG